MSHPPVVRVPFSHLGLLFSWLLSPMASAAGIADVERDIATEQQRQRFEFEQLHEQQRSHPQLRGPRETPVAVLPQGDEACWAIPRVRIHGATLISDVALSTAIAPHVSACMGPRQINYLLAIITGRYVDAGYIASRPLLSAPPAVGEPLHIEIEEGFVESIEWSGEALDLSLAHAFPGMLGKPLHLRDLEQGLEQLNRLRWLDLAADVAPGSQAGGSRIVLRQLSRPPRWSSQLGLDNKGSASTGRDRYTVFAGFDSPLGLNDALMVGFASTFNRSARSSRSYSLFYSIPYGYWNFSATGVQAESHFSLDFAALSLPYASQTRQLGLRAERLLWRRQGWQLSADARLTRKATQTLIARRVSPIQSSSLTIAQFGFNLFWLADGAWNLNLSHAQGLDWLGADRDAPRPEGGVGAGLPRSQFKLWRGSLDYLHNGFWGTQPWQWQSRLAWQASGHPLPASEQFLAGDDYAVRGFDLNNTFGASGAYWHNQWRLPLHKAGRVRVSPHVGLDTGWVKSRHGLPARRLSGAAVGVALAWADIEFDLEYQRALHSRRLPVDEPSILMLSLRWPL